MRLMSINTLEDSACVKYVFRGVKLSSECHEFTGMYGPSPLYTLFRPQAPSSYRKPNLLLVPRLPPPTGSPVYFRWEEGAWGRG